MTYFRACKHYHRPCELNDRVRNGNECDLAGLVTGKSALRRCPTAKPLIVPCGMSAVRRFGSGTDFPVLKLILRGRNQRGQVFPR